MNKVIFLIASLLALPVVASSDAADPREALKIAGATVLTDNGVPYFVQRGEKPLAMSHEADHGSRAKAAVDFLQQHARAYRLRDPATELTVAGARTDALGQHHYLLQQHLNGVPVRGAQAKAHFTADGELRVLSSRTVPTQHHVDTNPALRASAARQIVRRQFPLMNVEPGVPALEIREVDGAYLLTYSVETFVHEVSRWQTVLDAHTGEVLLHYLDHHDREARASGLDQQNNLRHFTAWQENGRYHMVDVTTPVDTNNENPLMRRSAYGDSYIIDFHNTKGDESSISSSLYSDAGWDPLAVSAMTNAQRAFHYFRNTHDHHGADGKNANLLVAIHFGDNYDNAFWNGKWLVFGDGGKMFSKLAACLDVVGHELAHGVIQHTAGLVYENQSGALNESFADVFGAMIERRNWTLGEGCVNLRPGYLRNMQDPHKGVSQQPKHMSEYVTLPNTKDGDWGGVHVNSGIPNRAAYLLIEGLSQEGLGTSIGAEKAEALYFRALSTYLVSTSQFLDLRRALLLAADDLFPGEKDINASIRAAFDAVGIVEKPSTTASPGISASASMLDFEKVAVGRSRTLSLRFTNTGATTVTVNSITVSDGFSHSFSPMRIPAGSVMEGSVTFRATSGGTFNGHLTVQSDSVEPKVSVALKATAISATQQPISGEAQDIENGGGSMFWLLLLVPLARARIRRS